MIILHNANIFSPDHRGATALAIEDDRFIAVGNDAEILASFPSSAKTINLHGMTILPGLIDAHIHLRHLAESMSIVDCETSTLQECLLLVKNVVERLPKDAWVRGHGWNHNQWREGYGNANLLDQVCEERPAYLTAKSLHAGWANSQALKLAGIDAETPDPPGGVIQRSANGQPTGILLEAGAMNLIETLLPKPTVEDTIHKMKALLPELWKVGLIGIHDFDDYTCWMALQVLNQECSTLLRVHKQIPFTDLDVFINAGMSTGFGDYRLSLGGVKLFSDGALGPHTAAMHEPYEGTHTTGDLLLTEDEIVDIGCHSANHGVALTVHAIGDKAIHIVLNAIERIRIYEEIHHYPHLPHRIEHVQIITPDDLPRFKKLGVIASIQPVHAPSDMVMADRFLGQRSHYAYAYRSILDAGADYVMGSDAPVEPFNPFYGIHAAVTRRRLDGSPGDEGWHPDQRISLAEALQGFSLAPCLLAGHGRQLGKISPGYQADFLILKEDPFKIHPHDLGSLKPLATFIAGECKHNSVNFPFEVQNILGQFV